MNVTGSVVEEKGYVALDVTQGVCVGLAIREIDCSSFE